MVEYISVYTTKESFDRTGGDLDFNYTSGLIIKGRISKS